MGTIYVGEIGVVGKSVHKNSNSYIGNFGIYEIKINGETYKFGIADLDRVTKSSGQPTRLHQQASKLKRQGNDVSGTDVIERFYNITKAEAKVIENSYIQNYYNTNSTIPIGNQNSFKIK